MTLYFPLLTIPQNSFQAYFLIQLCGCTRLQQYVVKVLAEEVRKELSVTLNSHSFFTVFQPAYR